MVDWRSYKLMSVSFSFIVSPDESGSLDNITDGKVISTSIDNQLKTLRQMASSPYPVVFMGFDKLLEEPARFPFNNDAGKGSLFVIADMNVSSIYRSSSGAISRASVDMTLTEYPKELIKLIEFPKLRPIPELPPPPPGEEEPCDSTLAETTWNRNTVTKDLLRQMARRGFITYNGTCSSIVVLHPAAYNAVVNWPALINRVDNNGRSG